MTTDEKPLVEVKVTNPVTYLKNWWSKVMGKEGIDFSFRIHPVTAVAIAVAVALVSFGAGRFSINIPFLKYEVVNSPVPTPTPSIWKETAYTGTLQKSKNFGSNRCKNLRSSPQKSGFNTNCVSDSRSVSIINS